MSKIELIYTIAIAVVALVLVIYYIIKGIKNGWVNKITQTIEESIRYAETHVTGAAAKKKYVMEQVENKCIELGIPYTFIRKLVDKVVENIIKGYNVIDHE